jgi:hypothetical protein
MAAHGSIEWHRPLRQDGDATAPIDLSINGLNQAAIIESNCCRVVAMAKRDDSWPTNVMVTWFWSGSYMPSSLYQRFNDDGEWHDVRRAKALVEDIVTAFDPNWVAFKPASVDDVPLDKEKPHISVGWLTYAKDRVISRMKIVGPFEVSKAGDGVIIVSEEDWPTSGIRIAAVADSLKLAIRPPADWDVWE